MDDKLSKAQSAGDGKTKKLLREMEGGLSLFASLPLLFISLQEKLDTVLQSVYVV